MEKFIENSSSNQQGKRFRFSNENFAMRAQAIIEADVNGTYHRFRMLLADTFETPYSVMSLASPDDEILRVQMDSKVIEVPRKNSFCGYVLESSEVLIVQNAIEDDRFSRNPMVSESMHIRFYAGVPLVGTNGEVFGTICVMDTKQREHDERAIAIHKSVARQVADYVEIELRNEELLLGLEARENGFRSIVNRLKAPLDNLSNVSDDLGAIVKESVNLEFDDKAALLARYTDSARGIVSDAEAGGLRSSLQSEVDKIFEMFSVEAKSKHIKLNTKIAKNIEIGLDGDVVATLLRKTIFNGIKFCLNGGSVSVEAWKTARYVLVSVSDSGVGIGPDKLQSILNGSGQSSGSVLGLSMCQRLLEENNGHLDIISETGMGTTVSMSFPC